MIIPDVIIHTGNLLKNQHAKRYFSKNALSTSGHKNKELENALENKVFKLTENGSWSHLKTTDCPNDEYLSVHSEENEISISTKIFISAESKPDVIRQAQGRPYMPPLSPLPPRQYRKTPKIFEILKVFSVQDHLPPRQFTKPPRDFSEPDASVHVPTSIFMGRPRRG